MQNSLVSEISKDLKEMKKFFSFQIKVKFIFKLTNSLLFCLVLSDRNFSRVVICNSRRKIFCHHD